MPIPRSELVEIRKVFQALEGPVKIDYFHQSTSRVLIPGRRECPSCAEALAALTQIAELSERVTLTVYEFADEPAMAKKRDVRHVPGIVIRGELNRPLRYYGLPAGHLLPVFVDTIVRSSLRDPKPPAPVLRAVRKLRAPVRLRVLGSYLQPASAQAALLAGTLALVSPKLQADLYTIEEFPELAAGIGIDHIPATFVGDEHGFAGVTTPDELARYILDVQTQGPRADFRPPRTAPGSMLPWRPPRRREAPPPPAPDPATRSPGSPRGDAAPPGMRQTAGGLIIPDR